ncbi:unnamed protein product, partial [Mesorhabditis spiculigera]
MKLLIVFALFGVVLGTSLSDSQETATKEQRPIRLCGKVLVGAIQKICTNGTKTTTKDALQNTNLNEECCVKGVCTHALLRSMCAE